MYLAVLAAKASAGSRRWVSGRSATKAAMLPAMRQ